MSTVYAITPSPENLELALELAELTRPTWARVSAGIPAGTPRLEGESDAGDAGDEGESGDDAGTEGAGGGKGDDDDGDADDADDPVATARKAAAAANAELRDMKRAQAERDRKAAEQSGKWEDLYKQEKARADKLEEEAQTGARERLAMAALAELRCKNPGRYLRLMDLDKVEDEADALRAARNLRKSDPDLFRTAATRQKRNGGNADDADDDDAGEEEERDEPRRRTQQQRQPVNRLRRGLEKTTPK
jgi:hypothetical protein